MRLTLLGLLTAATFGIAQAQSDSVAVRRNVVKINPLSLVLGQVSIFYERAVSNRISLVGGVGFGSQLYTYPNNKANVPSSGRFRYERLTLEGRYYLSRRHRAPIGFYAGIYGRFARLMVDDYQFDSQGEFIRDQNGILVREVRQMQVLMPGALAGWQAALGRRVALDLFFGLQYQIPTNSTPLHHTVPEAMSTKQLVSRAGLTFGYRF